MEDGIHMRIIYGKIKPKLIADYRGAGLFSHIILNRKVKPVNHAYDMLVTYVFDSIIFGTFIPHLNLC